MAKVLRSIGTHDGSFHADEVTACALLILFDLVDRDKIVRTRNLNELSECEYVCDVGGIYDPDRKLFDHHQVDYDGTLSSAGMILQYLLERQILSEGEYRYLNDMLIHGVDEHDNGIAPFPTGYCTYSHVISNYAPIQHDSSPEEQNETFFIALDFALGHVKRLRERYAYIQSCRELMEKEMAKSEICLTFDKRIPWLELFFELGGEDHPARFMIMPSGEHWTLRGIPPTYEDRMNVRHPLPKHWAGLLDQDLKEVSGISGAIFCHKGLFISVWETKEDAQKALDFTLSREEEAI